MSLNTIINNNKIMLLLLEEEQEDNDLLITYELFVKAQKLNNKKVLYLKTIVETRWAYWYT